jgi:signal transduction histidine kinase
MAKRGQGDRSALDAIARQVDRLTHIVQQLLDVSRLRAGGRALRRERFDLGDLAAEVIGRVRGESRVELLREGAAAVLADRDRIGQVVANLVENALEFSARGGAVEAAVQRRDGDAVLTVRQRGGEDAPGRPFERFQRARAAPTERGGLGLGLDVSREIVARHGGKIWFESGAGRGPAFSFSLPLAAEEEAA